MGGITAPVVGSGSEPVWIRVVPRRSDLLKDVRFGWGWVEGEGGGKGEEDILFVIYIRSDKESTGSFCF